jgi:hypothetical protein
MKKMAIIGFLLVAFMACTTQTVAPETGSIDIKFTVGPLCPVAPCNKTKEEFKQIYEAYSFVITNPTTKSVISEQKVTYIDNYGVVKLSNLAVGDYEIGLNPVNFFTKKGFPMTVKIEKDKTTSLEIDVDTGIR